MDNQIQLAFNQLIEKIEPITRFDESSLKQAPSRVRVATGRAFWRFTPHISNKREEHTDRLPYQATRIDSSEELDEIAERTLKSAYEALPKRIESWLRINERTDRELMPSNCFDGPKIFGYEYRCHNCLGEGWVKCPDCANGYNKCLVCEGAGKVKCPRCDRILLGPSGQEDCGNCGATGKKDGHVCPTCNGHKKVTCQRCGGRKTIDCKKCGGRGQIPCKTCNTTDRVNCLPCKGTGFFHVLRTVECEVSNPFTLDLRDEKSEVAKELRSRDLEGLREFGTATQTPPTVENNVVKREYDYECIITELNVLAGEEQIELIGYGDKAKILDHKGIASILLQADLEALTDAATRTPLRFWGTPLSLITATKQFLESEVNVAIDNPRWIQENIVKHTYIEQVKTYLPDALQKLFAAHIGLAFLVTGVSTALIFIISLLTGLQETIGNFLLLPMLIAAVTSWVLLEKRARTRLRKLLDDGGEKADGLLRKYYILWKARGLAFALTASILLLALLLQ